VSSTLVLLLSEQRPAVRQRLHALLQGAGYQIAQANQRTAVLCPPQASRPALAIIGLVGTSLLDSIALVRALRTSYPDIPVVVFAAESSEDLAIAAIRAGVTDYVREPDYEELISAVTRCLRIQQNPLADFPISWKGPNLIGRSDAITRIRDYIINVASADCNVLITGETGTGKELVAEAIHLNSPRRDKPFVAINCAAIPDTLLESELFGYERGAFTGALTSSGGRFQQAHGGCVFLDEIGDMSPILQAKILRAIESKTVQCLGGKGARAVDIRFIAATNQDLERLILESRFRSDLFYRLGVTQVRLPPLRERPEDIPLLAELFVRAANQRLNRNVEGISPAVMSRLMRHSWPGNVRELRNLMEALFVTRRSGWFSMEDLPSHFMQSQDEALEVVPERSRILSALQTTNWNKSKAASELRWCRMTLYRKMAKYKISSKAKQKPANHSTHNDVRALRA